MLGNRENVTITIEDIKICLHEESQKAPSDIDSDLIHFCVELLEVANANQK